MSIKSKINIDFGTTQPDTNKLWVPLSQEPNHVTVCGKTAYNESVSEVFSSNSRLREITGEFVDGTLYLMLGGGSSTYAVKVYKFNEASASLEELSCTWPYYYMRSTAVACGGYIYTIGGLWSTSSKNYIYKFTPATGEIKQLTSLQSTAYEVTATRSGDRVYFFSGIASTSRVSYYGYIDTSTDEVVKLGTNSVILGAAAACA